MTDLESRLRTALEDETSGLTANPRLAEDLVSRGAGIRRRRRLAEGVAGLVVLAALVPMWRAVDSSEGSPQPVAPGPTITTPTATRPMDDPSDSRSPAWQRLPVAVDHAPRHPARVVDVRVGRHATYDRVVVDFDGAISGYRIERVPKLVRDGSGVTVTVPGADKVLIRLTPATAHSAAGASVYRGPGSAEYTMPALRGFAFLGDFEGVSLGLGIDGLTTVRVLELTSPSRLVIDLHH